MGNRHVEGLPWAADNGCFKAGEQFNAGKWWTWLIAKRNPLLSFAVAPDVVGDHDQTVARSSPWLCAMREEAIPAAFVAQNGSEGLKLPWDDFSTLFIGGTDPWRYGPARLVAQESKRQGKWLHVGRVNSLRRLQWALSLRADSCDGTYLCFGPGKNLPKLIKWLKYAGGQLPL